MSADKQRQDMLYFGYGSNMCAGRLQQRVPTAKPLGKFFLRTYRFKFNKRSDDRSGKGNVESAAATDVVWGVLFEFDAAEKYLLDEVEGLGRGYDELIIEVESETGKKERAQMYIAARSHIDDTLKPYSWYKRFVIEGASQHQLPQAYTDFLQSFAAIEDPDSARDRRNRAIIC